jgi:hypothetical protein
MGVKFTTEEHRRLLVAKENNPWKNWGPFLSERQWGTVREDYSHDGSAWEYTTHDMARSYAYRWGEEGIAGISDNKSLICFAVALWNGKDPILKERLYGMTGNQGNHGEDVKELYYYLDNTPTHSYMKMLYKYPQAEFPYQRLIDGNSRSSRQDPEYELIDTGVFDNNEYFDVFVEYAKAEQDDLCIKITVYNRGPEEAEITVLPTLWFRNIWAWGYDCIRPRMSAQKDGSIKLEHYLTGDYHFYAENAQRMLFCENETNNKRLYNKANKYSYCKDGINDYIIYGNNGAVNLMQREGTKASAHFKLTIPAGGSQEVKCRLSNVAHEKPFETYDQVFNNRLKEAEEFYDAVMEGIKDPELRMIQRQGYAGMLWTKQFYYFNIHQWLSGDPANIQNISEHRKRGRNHHWIHLNNSNVISMPDKWEYPWYAAWDLAFHCIPLARIDPDFAKRQLTIMLREYYMHPNGQIPAYEWNFSDVNPPVHAWACWRVYEIDREMRGEGDTYFLERVFHKLVMNFTWWINQKDKDGKNIFEGGFLGLDNIGVFDRSQPLPIGGRTEQADGTSWMAMYSLNMLKIATELAMKNPVYQDMASKYFEHFLYIAGAMNNIGGEGIGLWDDEEQFFFDIIHLPNGNSQHLKVRSIVGLIPLFAIEVISAEMVEKLPDFKRRLEWVLENRPDLASQISRWFEHGKGKSRILSLLRGHRMTMVLKRMLDEGEFLSEYGIRALSKAHESKPYEFHYHGKVFAVSYKPAESDSGMFGGNSNWRGPIWFPINYMIVESLLKFADYYGDEFKIEHPTGSGQLRTLKEIARDISDRLVNLFRMQNGRRAVNGGIEMFDKDPHFKDLITFYEFFHGDNGRGCGASHQTGWTGLVTALIHEFNKESTN